MKELFSYYSLDEAINKELVINKLISLQKDSKIELNFDGDIFKIKDIDLEEIEIEELLILFDENDIFPYHDIDDDDDIDDYDYYNEEYDF
jgi:hypothetical protein